MTLTPDELRQIEERAEKATKGPWWWDDLPKALCQVMRPQKSILRPGGHACYRVEDENFIAFARTDIPALLAHVRELEAREEKWKKLEAAAKNFFIDYNDPESDPNYIGVLLIEMEAALAALEEK